MSHIIEFTISGLAGRKQPYHKVLNKDVNIFFGLNGSGKTSLIKILHSALNGNADILRNVPFNKAHVTFYNSKLDKKFTRTITQVDNINSTQKGQPSLAEILSFDDDIPEAVKREIFSIHSEKDIKWESSPKQPKFQGIRHTHLPVSRPYLIKRSERLPLSEGQLDLLFARNLQDLWTRYSNDLLGSIRKVQDEGLANVLRTILSTEEVKNEMQHSGQPIDVETAYNQMITFFTRQKAAPNIVHILGSQEDFKRRYNKDRSLQNVVSDIHNVEEEIEQAIAPRQKLQQLIQKMFSHKQIEFTDSDILVKTERDVPLGLHLLSSGERQLMLIFLETFLAGESIILIDEPEMSMHIDWQLELVSAMQQLNPKAQLILTTHSPEIMAEVADDKVFRLNYE